MTTPNGFCGKCGASIVNATDAFCPKCGAPYAATVSATPDEPALVPPTPAEPTVTPPEEPTSTTDVLEEPRASAEPLSDAQPTSIWRKIFLFQGTLSRKPFIWLSIASYPVTYGLFFLFALGSLVMGEWFFIVAILAFPVACVAGLSIATGRLRDIGKNPWYALLSLVPLVGFVLWIGLLATPTDSSPKRALIWGGAIIPGFAVLLVLLAVVGNLLPSSWNESTSNSTPSVSSARSAAPTATPVPRPTATPRPRATATPRPGSIDCYRGTTTYFVGELCPATEPKSWASRDVVAEVGESGGWGYEEAWYSFDMEATFHNPQNSSDWDYGFGFHGNGDSMDIVVLTYDGMWGHIFVDGTSRNTIDQGFTFTASLLDTHAYGSNKLRLTVNGTSGQFYVNGTKIADIRVSSSPRASGLGVATCIFSNGCIKPATVKVTDFKASPL
jgi:uncharacterized membrane protein YhaH (DUF805 family)